MPDTSPLPTEAKPAIRATLSPKQLALKRRFPTAYDLRARARKRLPNFAFEYADGGAGADTGIARNWNALDAVEMVPRYGRVIAPPPAETTLFGKTYAGPIGIAPIGGPGTAFPGAETYLAKAAQEANVPYTLGLLSGLDIEEAAEIAPDVLWLQLYRFANNDHKIGFDLVRRAATAGVNVLVLTIDTPTRTTRPREVKSGIMNPFKLTMRLRLDAMRSPHWMRALMRNGIPKFTALAPYVRSGVDEARAVALGADAAFVGKAFLWSLGALGARGPEHLINLLIDDVCATLGQLGCRNVDELRSVAVRHPGMYSAVDFDGR